MGADLFSSVALRDDIATGELAIQQFAANLQEVIEGKGPDAYRDPAAFFASSHPSNGMQRLLNEALGRISGTKANAPSVIRLETSLGGGKTHSLIALYHAARCTMPSQYVSEFMNPAYQLKGPVQHIAVFVGDETGATSFAALDGITPKTLWGHIALQIGGKAAYELVRADDERLTSPGANSLESMIGDDPAIIMLDEIARYLTVAAGVITGDNTLADQTVAFLMALIRAVEAKPHAILVITTTEATDVFGEQTDKFLRDFRSVLARKEYVIPPAVESDLSAILARRLFKRVSGDSAKTVARAYCDAVETATKAGANFPETMNQATWTQALERSYPFHPSLITVLDKRISTMPNFQHTRGALRLLGLAVRDLWSSRPANTSLIHLHHLNLKNQEIVEEVTGHIDRSQFKQVVEIDIASASGASPSHAEAIDAARGGQYARNLASSIYYWSLTRDVPGVPESALLGSVLAPDEDVNRYQRALEELSTNIEFGAWYLTVDARGGYRFGTEASPIMVLREIEDAIKPNDIARKCTDLLEDLFRDGALKVRRFWQGQQVPDNSKDCYLVVFHWDDFPGDKGIDPNGAIPPKIEDVWTKGPAGGPREFRNRLVLLAADKSQHQAMLSAVRKHMALSSLIQSNDNMNRFTTEQQAELRQQEQQSELEAKVAVAAHMSLLFVPQKAGLQMVHMTAPNKADIRKNQTDLVLEQLKSLDKVLVAGSNPYAPFFLKSKLGNFFNQQETTASLEKRLATNADFKILLDGDSLRTTIQNGIAGGDWEYYDPGLGDRGWATRSRPRATVQISSQTYICPVGSAPAPQAASCPICGNVHAPGGCAGLPQPGGAGGGTPPTPPPGSRAFHEKGAAGPATSTVLADARDANRLVSEIEYAVSEVDKSLAWKQLSALTNVIPAATKGVSVRYRVAARAELREAGDVVSVTFEGSSDDLQLVKETIRSIFMRADNRSSVLDAQMKASFNTPQDPGCAAMAAIAQSAATAGPANCTVTITTEEQAA